MDPRFASGLLVKWLHLSSAAILIGGLVTLRYIVSPGMAVLAEDGRAALREAVRKRSLRWLLGALVVSLVTGLDNIFRARKTLVALPPDKVEAYWSVFWLKIGAFVAMAVLLHLLLLRIKPLEPLKGDSRTMTGVTLFAGLIVILLSGYLTLTRLSALAP